MTTPGGSLALRETASNLIARLGSLQDAMVEQEVSWAPHSDACLRAADLASYLRTALKLSEQGVFAPGFSLLRSSLERWATDSIVMLGDRFVQDIPDVSESRYVEVREQWRRGEHPSVLEEPALVGRLGTTLRLVILGYRGTGGEVLHPIYFEGDRYDPFFGPPGDQGIYSDRIVETSDDRSYAVRQRQIHNTYFRWGSIVDSLVLNRLVEDRHRIHLDVHYRFLSAYVHAYQSALQQLQPRTENGRAREPHTSEELCLLYIVQLSARYLGAFLDMTRREPRVGLEDAGELRALASDALQRSSHLWFLADEPQLIDRANELLRRTVENGLVRPTIELRDLGPTDVRYYSDPLKRLRQMHVVSTEGVTGITHVPPWET